MRTLAVQDIDQLAAGDPGALLGPPSWVESLLQGGTVESQAIGVEQVRVRCMRGKHFTLVSSHIPSARRLGREQLAETVYRCYMRTGEIVFGSAAPHPVRFWNHLGRIHEPMGEGLDRYMAFNMGRFRAFDEWYGGSGNFDRRIATASGVGCHGDDIVIHVLSGDRAGIAVANPRQVQPFHYSERFGPKPPCFARATILPMLEEKPILLIGGTASIRGEESMFIGDLEKQLAETFDNIAALLANASFVSGHKCTLEDLSDLRVYVVDPSTRAQIQQACRKAAPHAREIQLLDADLCRRELLVEIEGRATLR